MPLPLRPSVRAAGCPGHVTARNLDRMGGPGSPPGHSGAPGVGRRHSILVPALRQVGVPASAAGTCLRFPAARIRSKSAVGDTVATPRSRASRTGPSTGRRCPRDVSRSAPGCRTAFRRCGSPGCPGFRDPRLPLRRTSPEADGAPSAIRQPHYRSRRSQVHRGPQRCRTDRRSDNGPLTSFGHDLSYHSPDAAVCSPLSGLHV